MNGLQTPTAPRLREEADQLTEFLLRTQRHSLANFMEKLHRYQLSYAQFFFLGYLANESYLTMTMIARKMNHSTAAATGMVDRLSRLGYVERFHAMADRRKVVVQITEKGRKILDELREAMVDQVAQLLVSLDGGAKNHLVGVAARNT